MRIWVDLTNSPHVLVMRPVIDVLRARGAEVRVTARDFAQTVQLCERFGMEHEVIGRHRGGRVAAKAVGLAQRSGALVRWGRRNGPFDLALGHGSNDVTVAARLLRIPCSTMFDYEWATVQHNVNCRLAQAVVVPEAIPPERLERYGARGKLQRYPGLKEEYYLADFEPDPAVLDELGLDRAQPLAVVRTPPVVSLYHRFENDVFADVLARLRGTQTVVLPRIPEQRAQLDGFIVPERAIDAQSLIAYADVVVSAGGTMNREAVALGTPVWTTFEGRMGAVDERLIAEGRLRRLQRRRARSSCAGARRRAANACAAIRPSWSICSRARASPWATDIRAQPRAPIRRSSRGSAAACDGRRSPVPLLPPNMSVKASVVVVTYGQRAVTERGLDALAGALGEQLGRSWELVLVDNASPDDTPALLRQWSDRAEVLLLQHNLDFAGGCNAGAARARGDVLVFLNNDTEVVPARSRHWWRRSPSPAWRSPARACCSRTGRSSTPGSGSCATRSASCHSTSSIIRTECFRPPAAPTSSTA